MKQSKMQYDISFRFYQLRSVPTPLSYEIKVRNTCVYTKSTFHQNTISIEPWFAGSAQRDWVISYPLLAFLNKLGLEQITVVLKTKRLRWHGHVTRSSSSIKNVMGVSAPGSKGRGRPRKTWEECVKRDIQECGLTDVDPLDRNLWRAGVCASRLLPTPVSGNVTVV